MGGIKKTHLIEIDNRLPELILQFMKIPHSNLPEISGVIFVDVRSVVVRASGHTAASGMLAVLAYSTVTGGDVATARFPGLAVVLLGLGDIGLMAGERVRGRVGGVRYGV